jgi:ABC-type spermidine/putrescine transport system permease subunit I
VRRPAFLTPLNLIILAGVAVLGFFILYPILFVIFGSFWSANPGLPGHLTLNNYVEALDSLGTYSTIWNTLVLGTRMGTIQHIHLRWCDLG